MLARALRRLLAPLACVTGLAACSSLIGLDDLHKVDCVDGCSGATSMGGSASSPAGGGMLISVAGASAGSASGGVSASGALNAGGSATGGSVVALEAAGAAGEAGGGGSSTVTKCPGGAAPPLTWTEHWFEHNQVLNRVYYDDCVAIYFDTDMDPTALDWIAPFLTKSWAYSLATYGTMGSDRLFGVFHMGRYEGGHSANYYDPSHDFRNTIDCGQDTWPAGSYDLPAHLMGFIVEGTATHTKYGAPPAALWGSEAWPELYKYDLYSGLGLTSDAQTAYTTYLGTSEDSPIANTFWFRDWFYPLWRDNGHAQVMTRFFGLMQRYYPADATGNMADMNWGQFVHFMSGAAGKNLQPLAMSAFGWSTAWEQEFQQAESDFPQITY